MSRTDTFLAIVNPAAGGGRCRKLVSEALDRLRAGGTKLDEVETTGPGQGTQLARDGYARGYRRFIAVGGDGTSYEIVNGVFPRPESDEAATLVLYTGPPYTGHRPCLPVCVTRVTGGRGLSAAEALRGETACEC